MYLLNWTSGKNTLAIENVVFAQSIVGFQKQFSSAFTEFIQKIYMAVYMHTNEFNVNYKNLLLSLNSPRGITLSNYAENMNNLSTIFNTLKEIGIDSKIIVNMFWPELYDQLVEADVLIKQLNKESEMQKLQSPNKPQNPQEGGMGDMGMGGGMDFGGFGGGADLGGGDATTDSLEKLANSPAGGGGGMEETPPEA